MTSFAKYTLLSIILLSGCTHLPPHPQSVIRYPLTTRTGTPIICDPRDFSQIKWWKRMHDPVLNKLIHEALVHNNQIKTAQANILQARAKLLQARFSWLPSLNLSGNGFVGGRWDSEVSLPGILQASPALSRVGGMHFNGYFAGFVPKYSLNILQNISNDKLAKASLNLQNATLQSIRLSVISQISGAYFMLLGHKAQESFQIQLIHDLKESSKLEQVRYHDGASDYTMVAQINRQIANSRASLESTQNSIAQVENAMQVLLNQNPGPIITHRSINTLSVKGLIPANIPSAVLKRRPDMIIAEENLNISMANVGMAYSQFFPNISLTGLLGSASVELVNLLKISTGLWVADAAASMPLLNGAAYAQIKAAKAGYRASYYNYLQAVRSVFVSVDDSLTNHQKMNNAYHHQLEALRSTQTAYQIAKAKYDSGASDFRNAIQAKIAVDNAKLDTNLAKMQQLDSLVQVYQALAGGYKGC